MAPECESLIKKFQLEVITSISDEHDLSLLRGLAGKILFLWYCKKAGLASFEDAWFNQTLNKLIENSSASLHNLNLGYGITGIASVIELVLFEEGSAYDPAFNRSVSVMLLRELQHDKHFLGENEYVLGLSGLAVFAARRAHQAIEIDLYNVVVESFEKTKIQISSEQCAWNVPSSSMYRFNKNCSEYNLGLAHGVPGIIASLLPALEIPELADKARPLIYQGCDWLLTQKLKDSESYFSHLAGEQTHTRLAWCYGDLGIALTLARAGLALKEFRFVEESKKIALHATTRDVSSAMAVDAGLCHGTAGIALMFNRLSKLTNLPECEAAANIWLARTLEKYTKDSLKGLYAFKGKHGYIEETGLLEGYAGIGLCLLALTHDEPAWVDLLLLG